MGWDRWISGWGIEHLKEGLQNVSLNWSVKGWTAKKKISPWSLCVTSGLYGNLCVRWARPLSRPQQDHFFCQVRAVVLVLGHHPDEEGCQVLFLEILPLLGNYFLIGWIIKQVVLAVLAAKSWSLSRLSFIDLWLFIGSIFLSSLMHRDIFKMMDKTDLEMVSWGQTSHRFWTNDTVMLKIMKMG